MVETAGGYYGVASSGDYDSPYYSGSAVAGADLVPGLYPVAINGRPYILNTDPQAIEVYGENFKEESLPLLRAQADQGRTAGEQSLSPSQFWRRSADSWHSGAGQAVYDREESSATRFNTSKGIDPWTRYQLTLLPSCTNILASANTNLVSVATNDLFYVADGTTLKRTADLSSFANITGAPAAQANSLAAAGAVVYAGYGASGVYSVAGTVATVAKTGQADIVGYAKGRLLVGSANILYNPLPGAGGALGTPAAELVSTNPDTAWRWSAFAEGPSQIYAAGFVGTNSRIYKIAGQPDGTGLTAASVAATLPTGEIVRSMYGYLGYLVVGTSKGVRFATIADDGNITLGALIPTPGPVWCADGVDRFVWFGWSSFDTTSSGLGRLDLSVINDGLAPAYASDLMGTGLGVVRGTGVIGARRLFTVDGVGVFAEQLTPLTTGFITSGQISFGLSDSKVPVAVDLKHSPLAAGASIQVGLSVDRAASTTIGASDQPLSVSPAEAISTGQRRSEETELTFTLNAASGTGPILTRWTLLAYPAPPGSSVVILPLILANTVTAFRDIDLPQNPLNEYSFLTGLHTSREIITCQVGDVTFQGTLEEFTWVPDRHTFDLHWWSGTFIAKIRRIAG